MEKLKSVEQFHKLKEEERTIFMFTAEWCVDCKFIEPILPRVEVDYPEYTFISVDRDEFIDLCIELEIMGIPSFIAYHSGELVGRFVSKDRKTQDQIEDFINELSN